MRLGADLVGLSRSHPPYLSEQTVYTWNPHLLLVRLNYKLDAFEALNELFNLVQKAANHIEVGKSYKGVEALLPKI